MRRLLICGASILALAPALALAGGGGGCGGGGRGGGGGGGGGGAGGGAGGGGGGSGSVGGITSHTCLTDYRDMPWCHGQNAFSSVPETIGWGYAYYPPPVMSHNYHQHVRPRVVYHYHHVRHIATGPSVVLRVKY
jgi:hypothetical protein